jgi:hypothetical protein
MYHFTFIWSLYNVGAAIHLVTFDPDSCDSVQRIRVKIADIIMAGEVSRVADMQ